MQYFVAHGMADARDFFAKLPPFDSASSLRLMPKIEQYLRDGEQLMIGTREFEVIETDGHARGHQGFYCAAQPLLISGDQILPTISPNISLSASDWGLDPLGDYLASLERLRQLPAETLVLPAHGKPFYGLHERIDDLRSHHHEHLVQLRAHIPTPKSAFDLMPVLFGRRLKGFNVMLGLHECVAHLEHLVRRGEARRETSADGHHRYGCTIDS